MAVELKAMELKKRDQLTEMSKEPKEIQTSEQTTKSSQFWNFLADVKSELYKISWTTPEELKTYTKIVIGTTFCFGMGVYLTDLMIQMLLGTLESTIRMIGG